MNKISNEQGFALAIIAALLPCVLAGTLLAFATFGLLTNDLSLKYQCRTQGLKGQEKIAPLLTSLLALNKLSETLKNLLIAAEVELAVASSVENLPAMHKAQTKINQINEKRNALDKQQKQLIKQSNMYLRADYLKTKSNLKNTARQLDNIFLKTQFIAIPGTAPTLAVRPESSDIAPTYSLETNFENKQSLAHEWQYKTEVRPPFSNFISGTYLFRKACAVTLKKENSKWIPKINKAKYSLKSLW